MESENTTSGNKRVELLVQRSTKHGQAGRSTKSRTYMIWSSMIGRCYRPSDGSYKWYGAKGVTVCDRWRKFEDFFADMGTAPDGMHIHRTNGSTVYSKETCQWLSEHEHIGLHNQEKGWGARMTRTQLIDALAGTKQQLDAERERYDRDMKGAEAHVEYANKQLAAEREKVQALVDALEWYASGNLMTKVAKDALAKVKEGKV